MKYQDKDSYRHQPKEDKWSVPISDRAARRSVKKDTDLLFLKISKIDPYWGRTIDNKGRHELYKQWGWHMKDHESLKHFIEHYKNLGFGNLKKARELKIKDLLHTS